MPLFVALIDYFYMKNFLANLGQNVAIIGTQWGDEGKGKLVDAVSTQFDYICRSTGGANAGHTIYTNGKKFVFNLLPSGLLHESTVGVIGNGTVIDPVSLRAEVAQLEESGLENVLERVKISLHAHLLFDYHKAIDAELERRKGKDKIGTTCKGIGPCYEDKIARRGIRCEDLLDTELLKEKIEANCKFHSETLNIELDPEAEFEKIMSVRDEIKPLLCDTRILLLDADRNGKKILFEGAQAHHLDIDHGTYPFVTSSNVSAGGICTGLGMPPKKISTLIGITKAYTTRVGSGPFPTELNDAFGDEIREKGGEYGAVTKRPRRCGWFDAVVVRNAVEFNGLDCINLTKLDVLTGVKEIKVATQYFLDGQEIRTIPTTRKAFAKLEIKYETFQGWEEDISAARSFDDLPANAQKYVAALEEMVKCPMSVIGVGMDREDLIYRT